MLVGLKEEGRPKSRRRVGKGNAVMRAKVRKSEAKLVRRAEEEATAKSLGITPVELRAIRYNEANLHRPKGSTILYRPPRRERQRLFLLQEEDRRQSAGRGVTP